MSTKDDPLALLTDLARLASKYGPDTFRSLAALLQQKELRAAIDDFQKHTADSQDHGKHRRGSNSSRPVDPEKDALVRRFETLFRERRILHSAEDVRDFSQRLGIAPAARRERALKPISARIQQLTVADLQQLLTSLEKEASRESSGIREWGAIIFQSRLGDTHSAAG